jgi:hypothetical protein
MGDAGLMLALRVTNAISWTKYNLTDSKSAAMMRQTSLPRACVNNTSMHGKNRTSQHLLNADAQETALLLAPAAVGA